MIPYKDDNPTATFPFVTIGIIVLNVLVFIWEFVTPMRSSDIAFMFGAIPLNLMTFDGMSQPIPPLLSVVTSMFLHGGILHIAGNMLYFWIFGNNIEDAIGHCRFVVFYLLSGFAAAYSHSLADAGSTIPMIGASGAVSAVLGAYLYLYPRAQVHTIVIFGFFWQVVRVPAVVVIVFWIVIQVVSGLLSRSVHQGGVAWFAHVGGFFFGLLTVKLWLLGKRRYL